MPYKNPEDERARGRRRYWQNPEKSREERRRTYHKRKEHIHQRIAQDKQQNPEKYAEYQRRYRERHKEQVAAYNKQYWASHRKRANAHANQSRKQYPERWAVYKSNRRSRELSAGEKITVAQFLALCALYGNMCVSCFATKEELWERHQTLTPDHIVPLAKGGTNSIENLQPMCRRCNSAKMVRTTDLRLREIHG